MEANAPALTLPMEFDMKADPALYTAGYRHMQKPKNVLNWIDSGLGALLLANFFLYRLPAFYDETTSCICLLIGTFLFFLGLFRIFDSKKRFKAWGIEHEKATGGNVHYTLTDDGLLGAAEDGYSFYSFSTLRSVTSYPDMWIIIFGEKSVHSMIFLFKTALPDPAVQAAFEALLTQKLGGRQIVYK